MHDASRTGFFDAALILAAAFSSFAILAALTLAPKADSEGLAVVFAPWTNPGEVVARAVTPGARFVRFGAFDFIAVVEPAAKDYIARSGSNGVWFFADPAMLAACLKPFAGRKS